MVLQVEPKKTALPSSTTTAEARAPPPLPCFPCLEWSRSPLAHRQDRDANIAKTRKYFDVTVKNETGPTLFHTWEGYEAHLPRREASSGPPLDLYACNYYVTEADLDVLVSDMFHRISSSGRPDIKHAVHGSGQGKTACVLQGILHAERTRDVRIRYIQHLAFHNNNGRTFKASNVNLKRDDIQGAIKQGHALAVELLRAALNPDENGEKVFELQDDPPSYDECLKDATQLLRDAAGTGAVLVHLDEFIRVLEGWSAQPVVGAEHVRTGALAVLALAAARLGGCEDAAGTPRGTIMTTFIKPPDDTWRSSYIGKYMVGIPCVDEQRYAEVKMPRLLDPSQCELAGAAIDDAATEKLRQKGLIILRECLVYNQYGGLAGLQIGSPQLVEFEERINARLATTGAETPAGCGQSVPAGLAAAVSALAGSCMGLEWPRDLPYAAEMLLTVRVDRDNMNPGISSMLTDITTEGLRSLPGGRYSYSLRSLLQGQPPIVEANNRSQIIRSLCASSHAWTQPAKP